MKTTLRYANWLLGILRGAAGAAHSSPQAPRKRANSLYRSNQQLYGKKMTTKFVFEKHCFHSKATRYASVSTANYYVISFENSKNI